MIEIVINAVSGHFVVRNVFNILIVIVIKARS